MTLSTLQQSPVDATFWSFLGMQCTIDWARAGEFATYAGIAATSLSGCLCGVDPWAMCPVHACNCKRCGEDGKSCKWRGHFQKFIDGKGLEAIIAAKEGGAHTHPSPGDERAARAREPKGEDPHELDIPMCEDAPIEGHADGR